MSDHETSRDDPSTESATQPTSTSPSTSPSTSGPTRPATAPASTDPSTSNPLRGSRTSGLWIAVAASGIVLVLLIIFIAQNTEPANVNFLGWQGEAPLAVVLLVATVAGLFLATIAGSLRILQLRRRVKRESR